MGLNVPDDYVFEQSSSREWADWFVERTSVFETEMRGMLVEKTSPGLGALVNCCRSLRMQQKRRRDNFCLTYSTAFSRNILGPPAAARTSIRPMSRTNLVVDFQQKAECRGHGTLATSLCLE